MSKKRFALNRRKPIDRIKYFVNRIKECKYDSDKVLVFCLFIEDAIKEYKKESKNNEGTNSEQVKSVESLKKSLKRQIEVNISQLGRLKEREDELLALIKEYKEPKGEN